jgi:HPt (histidine-containing phosphotransfer) domain-containing protein
MSDLVYVNEEEGKKRVMNNDKLYVRLMKKFRDETTLDGYSEFLDTGDWDKLKTLIHTIKGIAANLSLAELFKQSVNMEAHIKNDSLTPDFTDSYKECFAQTMIEADKVIKKYE